MNHHYNPDWLNDDDLLAGFIARQSEFNFLRDELARAPREGSVQHYLLIGQRGAGKTTLLKRLAIAIRRDTELSDHLIALSFPEELYQVKNLADFWWATCEALADELDRQGNKALADQLFDAVDRSRSHHAENSEDSGLQTLLKTAASIQRRPVLLVDNLDMVFERIDKKGRKLKDPLSPAYWALREALSTTTSPIVIGGSVRLSEPFTDYDKAFYDFFLPKRLGKLALSEVRQVLEHLAERENSPEVKTRLHQRPGRIDALYELTGGNPRAIGFMFQLLRQGPNRRAVEDFEQLMDLTTPYYKARLEDLSEQAQVVMHALATRRNTDGSALRFGHTAAEIANHAGLPTNTISAQMDVLEREGLVEKSADQGRMQYRIAEQLFRLWLQMRASRRIRQNVIGLAEFLEAMYNLEEMTAELQRNGHGLNAARLAFAVADTRSAAPLRRGLEAYGSDCLNHPLNESEHSCRERLPSADLPTELATLRELKQQLVAHPEHGLSEAEQDALLGSLELRLAYKQTTVRALCQADQREAEVEKLRNYFKCEHQLLERYGLNTEDQERILHLRAKGFLPLPDFTPGDADAVLLTQSLPGLDRTLWRLVGAWDYVKFDAESANAWLAWGVQHAAEATANEWASVAGSLRRSKQFTAADLALSEACQRGETSRTWYEKGARFHDEKDWAAAESAYQTAIAIDPQDAWPWNGIGHLFKDQANCLDKAEAAYRKATELDPLFHWPWANLGDLLRTRINRIDDAEHAYRNATLLAPTNNAIWNNLGALLGDHTNRFSEVEAAYLKAIELDPDDSAVWSNLGYLLASRLERPIEAESAFQKAIKLDLKNGWAWGWLGLLYREKGLRDSAIEAFSNAITYDTEMSKLWQSQLRRLREQPLRQACQDAIQTANLANMREALNTMLNEAEDIGATLAGDEFITDILLPALADEHKSAAVLGLLWGLGFDRHARPLLLAFEAMVEHRPEMLDALEPEVRGAAKQLHERIQAALAAQNL